MTRDLFFEHALDVAPRLLGATIAVHAADGLVRVRITEVEAYHGVGVPGPYDSGSHSKDRRTERNASMFGPPGHAYVYLNYGMHYALNMVCSPDGTASGVLIRSGEVIEGEDLAGARRAAKAQRYRRNHDSGDASRLPVVRSVQLARGPGNLATALGLTRESHDGLDLFVEPFEFQPADQLVADISRGPRVGVSGPAGGPEFPWRFWVTGDPTVSAFRPGGQNDRR